MALSNFDLFGYQTNLGVHRTCGGGIVSILFVLLMLVLTGHQIYEQIVNTVEYSSYETKAVRTNESSKSSSTSIEFERIAVVAYLEDSLTNSRELLRSNEVKFSQNA